MSQDLFEKVRSAEESAAEIISQAQHQAREMIKKAQADCLKAERDQAQEQRALYQSILDTARVHVEDELSLERQEQRGAVNEQLSEAEDRLDAAATLIFERIVRDGDC